MVMDNARQEELERYRRDLAKRAVALAVQGRWEEAAELNRAILRHFPNDLEAWNRLGKALSELGRNGEARRAFEQALRISPNNAIARKNLARLAQLGDEAPGPRPVGANPHLFIEESGKACVTSLVNLAPAKVLLRLSPGHPLQIRVEGARVLIATPDGQYVGQVEPRLATRLARLIQGGNRYEATVTSVGEREMSIIIREVYKDPSQAHIVSFPSKAGVADYRVILPSSLLGEDVVEEAEEPEEPPPVSVKDWTDDDAEPGDDDAYTPFIHRIISADGVEEEEEEP